MINTKKYITDLGFIAPKKSNQYLDEIGKWEVLDAPDVVQYEEAQGDLIFVDEFFSSETGRKQTKNRVVGNWPYYCPTDSSTVPPQVEIPSYHENKPSGGGYSNPPVDNLYIKKSPPFNSYIRNEYIPAANNVKGYSKGLKMLAAIMTSKEGFYAYTNKNLTRITGYKGSLESYKEIKGKSYDPLTGKVGTRSYRTNNPGNIGNTDSGKNNSQPTLEAGIRLQVNYLKEVAEGKHRAYKLNKTKNIRPFYSGEVARNYGKAYGTTPYLPGYKFKYIGKLSQFIKIYATGARGGNAYLSMIMSFFKKNGITVTPNTLMTEIANINDQSPIIY